MRSRRWYLVSRRRRSKNTPHVVGGKPGGLKGRINYRPPEMGLVGLGCQKEKGKIRRRGSSFWAWGALRGRGK